MDLRFAICDLRLVKGLIFSILCIIYSAVFAAAQMPQTVQNGFSVERELGGSERHEYEVNLTKGQFLNFVVEQRGVDVVLRVFTVDGKFYDRLDSPNGNEGEEPIKFVSLKGGRYRFEISRYSPNSPTGKYFIKPLEIRQATEAEIKKQKLKEELLKIVVAVTGIVTPTNAQKPFYSDRTLFTTAQGYTFEAAALFEMEAKNPFKPPEGLLFEYELSEARVEDFGDTAILSVRQSYYYKNPPLNIDRTTVQRLGYTFKREKGEWHIIGSQRTYIQRTTKPVKLEAKQLEGLVGVYQSEKPSETLTVLREGNVLWGKFPEGEKFEFIPESENVFYVDSFMSIAFIRNENGATTQAVIHYPMPEDRMAILTKIK
jgi:hypothetical protein